VDFYSFFNSSTSYRVRIAFALKGIDPTYHGVNIRIGEQLSADYIEEVNSSPNVPAITEGDFRLGQSIAIIDWLDAKYPEPLLIPEERKLRAQVIEFSQVIASDMHPLNNLRVLNYLQDILWICAEQKDAWYKHWITEGMTVLERLLERNTNKYGGPWCFGSVLTLADCCLVPQMANALRMNCDLSSFPRSMAVYEHARLHPAFISAEPKNQPDYINP
jgi:maleylacetoacetate isomerase